jgi:beta-N-acetylhexosaminidase
MNYYEACATFWENGGDVLLFVEMDGFYDEMDKLIKKGILSIETLKNRAYRILCFKEQVGLFCDIKIIETMDNKYQEALLEETVQKSITLVRDRENLIPQSINKDTRILHIIVMNDSENYKNYTNEITNELKKLTDHVTQMNDPGPDVLFFDIRNGKYDLVICSIGCALSYGLNVARLARNMMHGWTKLDTPVIFVSLLEPYIHKEYAPAIDTIINTYGITKCTAKEVVKKMIGAAEINKNLYAHS